MFVGPGGGGGPGFGGLGNGPPPPKDEEEEKKKPPPKKRFERKNPTRVGRKKRKGKGPSITKLPTVLPKAKCRLRKLKLERMKDYLLLEQEFIQNQERFKPKKEKDEEQKQKVDSIRGSPLQIGTLDEIIDDNHAIVSSVGPEYVVIRGVCAVRALLFLFRCVGLQESSLAQLHKLPPCRLAWRFCTLRIGTT